MGLFHGGVPPWLVTWVAESTTIRRAIETGTFRGESALLLANRIGPCTSIEIDPVLAVRAQRRFESRSDITVVLGDSRDALPHVHTTVTGPVFYWLDGHWSGKQTGGEKNPCPVMAEIDAIHSRSDAASSVIAIDDARLFGMSQGADPTMQSWPRLGTVLQALERDGAHTFVADDVIVAVPDALVASFLSLHSASSLRQLTILGPLWPQIERLERRNVLRKRLRSHASKIRATISRASS